jgi:Sel1 repeat-containing protein
MRRAGQRFQAGDHVGAAKLLTSAAQAGHPLAQLRLAIVYEAGDGVPRDPKAAVGWYARATSVGEPAAQRELGGYYEEGDGVAENWDLAAKLYQASAALTGSAARWISPRPTRCGASGPASTSSATARAGATASTPVPIRPGARRRGSRPLSRRERLSLQHENVALTAT